MSEVVFNITVTVSAVLFAQPIRPYALNFLDYFYLLGELLLLFSIRSHSYYVTAKVSTSN